MPVILLNKFYKHVFKFSFFPRTIKDWNSLSENLVIICQL